VAGDPAKDYIVVVSNNVGSKYS